MYVWGVDMFLSTLRTDTLKCIYFQVFQNSAPQTAMVKQQEFFFSQCWRLKSKIMVSAGLVPSESCKVEFFPCFFPSFQEQAGIFGVFSHVKT
jgi:hypothetical protein